MDRRPQSTRRRAPDRRRARWRRVRDANAIRGDEADPNRDARVHEHHLGIGLLSAVERRRISLAFGCAKPIGFAWIGARPRRLRRRYLAHDTKRGAGAVKILHDVEPAGLYWFKQESATVADSPSDLVSSTSFVAGRSMCFTRTGRRHRLLPLVGGSRAAPPSIGRRPPKWLDLRLRTPSGGASQPDEGVRALHTAGKLHRDLKPSNVLVTPAGRVVILDFGLVRDLDAEGFAETLRLIGTPAYMSPEQSWGAPLTVASDWYAVGVMLFEALVGRSPFSGSVGRARAEA